MTKIDRKAQAESIMRRFSKTIDYLWLSELLDNPPAPSKELRKLLASESPWESS